MKARAQIVASSSHDNRSVLTLLLVGAIAASSYFSIDTKPVAANIQTGITNSVTPLVATAFARIASAPFLQYLRPPFAANDSAELAPGTTVLPVADDHLSDHPIQAVATLPIEDDPWSDRPARAAAIESLLIFPAEESSLPLVFAGGVTVPAAPHQQPRVVVEQNVASTGRLEEMFRTLEYSLAVVRQGEPVPALRLARFPNDLGQARAGLDRIEIFIKTVLPLILQTNEAILADRQELTRLRDLQAAGKPWSAIERSWLAELADRYQCEAGNLAELLRRVDVVPPSMPLAQGGVESGWGTSYAARVANAPFGMMDGTRGMPQPFASIGDAVEAYILNLNIHPAYAAFRNDRAAMRTQGLSLDGHRLIGHLLRYSELGNGYIGFVRQVMRENRMNDFDEARLGPR